MREKNARVKFQRVDVENFKSLATKALAQKIRKARVFIDRVLAETRREQRVKTLFGRARPIPDINSKNANMRGFAERTAVNTPLQGTAADLIKLAMIEIDAEMRAQQMRSRMLLQVHDELVFEVPEGQEEEAAAVIKRVMANAAEPAIELLQLVRDVDTERVVQHVGVVRTGRKLERAPVAVAVQIAVGEEGVQTRVARHRYR